MPEIIIVEPDITDEENEKNWERVQEVINSIIQLELKKENTTV